MTQKYNPVLIHSFFFHGTYKVSDQIIKTYMRVSHDNSPINCSIKIYICSYSHVKIWCYRYSLTRCFTFDGPSLIFFIWSLYFTNSASSLAIFLSTDSARVSTWSSIRERERDNTKYDIPWHNACNAKNGLMPFFLHIRTIQTKCIPVMHCIEQWRLT